MSAPVLVDTNVFVYSRDSRNTSKQRRAHEWLEHLAEMRRGRVSAQVLHEYYVTVTRKLKPGLTVAEARADLRALFHWLPSIEPRSLLQTAWTLQDGASLSFWDALVLGAAKLGRCGFVLSEDLPAGRRVAGIEVVSPFQVSPGQLTDP